MSNLIIPNGQAVITETSGDGQEVKFVLPERQFTPVEARLLRDMQALLRKYGWSYEMHCTKCMSDGAPHELLGGVGPEKVAFACRHEIVYFLGHTL